MLTIVRGATQKPVASQRLADFFSNFINKYEGFLYIGYPVIGTAEGAYHIDALLVSPTKGIVIFNLIEGNQLDPEENQDHQDDSYNKLESKLRAHKSLVQRRSLQVPIFPVTFAPAITDTSKFEYDDYPVCNGLNIAKWLDSIECWNASNDYYNSLVSVLQAVSTIRKGKKRDVQKTHSRGAKLKQLENSIANLDNLQGRAVIETVEGVQRIRGLAGSGKTIVLALKAAYLHAQHPDWKIAVTFNTRSLKEQFRKFINTFVIEQTNEEPDWDNLHIIHAWGAPGGGENNGLYYKFCQEHGLEYFDFKAAKRFGGSGKEFDSVCQKALNEFKQAAYLYDVILIDEAQDFPISFLRLCYELVEPTKEDKKRLVYAYDELQTLNAQSLPAPEHIFGQTPDGKPRVNFAPSQPGKPQQDIILKKCYRNSRPILATAHALGFGIYRPPDSNTKTGLVQIFEGNELWEEVGYEVTEGPLTEGQEVMLSRTEDSSPEFLETHSEPDDLIQFRKFNSKEKQAQWLVKAIKHNLEEDELRFDDIIVINPDPFSTRSEVGIIRRMLFDLRINSHLAGVDTSPDIFFDPDHNSVTFSGVFRAKGNEAGMVYIINAQDCYSSSEVGMSTLRNRLFTAITRSKAWVRVLGIGKEMQDLQQEFEKIKANKFTLKFRYPTEAQRNHLNIVHRDMTKMQRQIINTRKTELSKLVKDLKTQEIRPEDIDSEQRELLIQLLQGK